MPETSQMTSAAPLNAVRLDVRVVVGEVSLPVADLMALRPDSVLVLRQTLEDPVSLYVGNRKLAEGQLEETEGDEGPGIAVRVLRVCTAE